MKLFEIWERIDALVIRKLENIVFFIHEWLGVSLATCCRVFVGIYFIACGLRIFVGMLDPKTNMAVIVLYVIAFLPVIPYVFICEHLLQQLDRMSKLSGEAKLANPAKHLQPCKLNRLIVLVLTFMTHGLHLLAGSNDPVMILNIIAMWSLLAYAYISACDFFPKQPSKLKQKIMQLFAVPQTSVVPNES